MTMMTRRIGAILLALTLLLSTIPLSASAADYPTIALGTEVTVELDETTTAAIYAFTPEEDGVYRFYAYNSSRDTYGYLLDANGNILAEDDDGANSGNNFLIAYGMTAGTTYLLKAQFYTVGAVGSISLILEKAATPTAVSVKQGDTFEAYPLTTDQFLYTLEPDGAATTGVTWTSSDPAVLELYDDGYVRFMSPGTATLTVTTAEGLIGTCEVTVLEPLPLAAGDTVTATCELNYDVTYSFVPEKNATYAFFTESEQYIPYAELRYTNAKDLMVVAYDKNQHDREFRLQHELTAGEEYYLFVSGQLLDATFEVTAQEVVPATAMTLDHTTLEGFLDGGMRLRPVYTPANAIYETIAWESSDDTVVSVDEYGAINFLKEGTATVTATSENGFTASCEVTVGGYPTFSLCKTETVNIAVGGKVATYLFTPETDGLYAFYAASDYDTLGSVYDETGETELFYGDDYGDDRDFRVEAALEAGVTYQLKGRFYYDSQVGAINLTVVKIDGDGNVIHDVSEYVVTDDSHSGVCDGCGETVSDAHSYDENGLCVCGKLHIHTATEYSYNDTDHWYTCACGGYVQEVHSPDADGNCVCGWFEHDHAGELGYDQNSHWVDCTVCNQHINEEHTLDTDGNCVCGWFVHAHDGDAYDYDESDHWLICSQCGVEIGSREEHTYDEYGECICGDALPFGVYIGDTFIGDGEYLDLNGNVTTEAPTGGYAYYENGVLTLHDFVYTGTGSMTGLVYAETELELVLEGNNSLHSLDGDGFHMSNADLTVSGDGSLAIKADGDFDGIDVDGGKLTIESGTLNIDATDHGIEVYGDLRVNGGTITIVADDDGFDVNGDAQFDGGVIDIHAEDNGIDGYYNITINGGFFTIRTNDDNGIEAADGLTVNGGVFDIDANDECFYTADGTITVNGGEFTLKAGSTDAVMMAGTDIVFDEAMGTFDTITDDYDHIVLADENGDMAQRVTITSTDTIPLKTDWITLSQTRAPFSGVAHTPTVTVVDDSGNTLVKDTDYTLSWSADSIVSVGTYTLTVTGIGDYSGVKLQTYTVYEDVVYVGDMMLANGDYLANDAAETTSEAPAEGGYAHYADGVLTLNNFVSEGNDYIYDKANGYSAVIFAVNELTIDLIGDNTLIAADDGICACADLVIGGEGSLAINGEFGIGSYSGDITISGGTFDITANDDAIWGYSDVNITDGKLVIAAGSCGIYSKHAVNISGGDMTLLDAEADATDCYDGYGIYANSDAITISGGTVAIDTTYGIYNYDDSVYIDGGTVDITGEYGIWADYADVMITGGAVTINADDGIYAYYGVYASGGAVSITSTQYAMCADTEIVIDENVAVITPENADINTVGESSEYYVVDENGDIALNVTFNTYGDVTLDGTVDTADARYLLRAVVGLTEPLTDVQAQLAEMNGDGALNTSDVRFILRSVVGTE